MDLEAAKLANARAGRWTTAGMAACFVLAGGILLASLAVAGGSAPTPSLSETLMSTAH